MRRGEIWWADLGAPHGSAPTFRRPVLVISADTFNASTISTVTVVALTRTTRLAALPGNVALPADVSSLPHDSVVNVTQLVTLDKSTLEERVSAVPPWVIEQVERGIQRALGLGRA